MLNSNYVVAGEVYMQYVISNLEEVKDLIFKVQAKIDKELRLSQRERNWSAVLAVNIAGGHIAKRLGLLEGWNIGKIYSEISKHVL